MHKYLRSIGFKGYTNEQLDKLYYQAKEHPDRFSRSIDSEGNTYIEYRIAAAKGVGVAFRCRKTLGDRFRLEYYYPYVIGSGLSTKEKVEIIKESDRESYHGMCDELNLGVELIFFMQDMVPHNEGGKPGDGMMRFGGVRLAALATEGTVILPIKQTVKQSKRQREAGEKRRELLVAARDGDEEAMEELAREEMDLYVFAAKRAETEDILSIVESYFMPDGIESDKYSILGTITAMRVLQNDFTEEEIFVLTLNCNRVRFDVCINRTDLLGEPAVGRRLKAKIWMQGMIHAGA